MINLAWVLPASGAAMVDMMASCDWFVSVPSIWGRWLGSNMADEA
jgi:hypothetical protein